MVAKQSQFVPLCRVTHVWATAENGVIVERFRKTPGISGAAKSGTSISSGLILIAVIYNHGNSVCQKSRLSTTFPRHIQLHWRLIGKILLLCAALSISSGFSPPTGKKGVLGTREDNSFLCYPSQFRASGSTKSHSRREANAPS